MKFTLSWLKAFLDTNASLEQIANSLTMLGLEVEEIIDRSWELEKFEVAEIIETSQHPDADKLRICKVKTRSVIASGQSEHGNLQNRKEHELLRSARNEDFADETKLPCNDVSILQIVCGAPNARAGIKVVLAKIGTTIPNGNFKIKQSKIRGIESCGMLCSYEELNIKGDSTGIIELQDDAVVGAKITKYLGLDDPMIHINITPNRADGLGVYGIARDLAALGIGTLKPLEIPAINGKFSSNIELNVLDQEACPLFAICKIRNIQNLKTPEWLKKYLETISVGSISAIIDITNYISYTFGQPMHAYDADKIVDSLTIDTLKAKEKFVALNGKEYVLQEGDLVIKDKEEIHCLAGIIGGQNSAVSDTTSRIILEAAYFEGKQLARSGRKLMIDTDSRYRFERIVDREFTLKALACGVSLITEICGGEASHPKTLVGRGLSTRTLDFPYDFFASIAGFTLEIKEIIDILERLGFGCDILTNAIIKITIPSWRSDVSICEDIVEEIVRIYGYDKIPMIPLPNMLAAKIITQEQRRFMDLKRLVATKGYMEVVTWSFMDSKKAAAFEKLKEELMLQNPISTDLDYMRPSILPNLLKIARNNINRSYNNLSFFELGPIFRDAENIMPIKSLAGIRIGANVSKNPHFAVQNFDVFDIKADLELIFAHSGLELGKCSIKNEAPSYYHPTRSGAVTLGKSIMAYFGQIHPAILKIFDIDCEVMAFEVDLSQFPQVREKFGKKSEFKVSDYQMVNRDYAFTIDRSTEIGGVLSFIRNTDKNLIKHVNLFDIYSGEKIEKGKKSIAISVTIQDDNKTLTEEEINHVSKIIIQGVETKFGAVLRK